MVSACSESQHLFLHLKATKAIKAEAEDLRANGSWGGSIGIPVAELRRRARAKGKDIKIAEVFAGIQRRELSPELQKYKRQIVYRGDMIKGPIQPTCFLHRSRNGHHSGNVGSVETSRFGLDA